MHSARSHNDQGVTDRKFYIQRTLQELQEKVEFMVDEERLTETIHKGHLNTPE